MNAYAEYCRAALHAIGRPDVPWQVLEANMLCEYGSLSHLSRTRFTREASIAASCWDQDCETMLALAESFGFPVEPGGR
jgi:hypothetical protein